jgi:hypothetical protein
MLVALLVILGAAGPGLASMICRTPQCPKSAPVVETPKTCCASSKSDKAPEESAPVKNCCCEIESATEAVVGSVKMVLPAAVELPVVLPTATVRVSAAAAVVLNSRIPEHSDGSPPTGASSPDQSRAPPSY